MATRAHIRLNTTQDAVNFVTQMNVEKDSKYFIEDAERNVRASAKSLLGVIYAMSDYNDEMYLVNETADGSFPAFVNQYRVDW